MSYNENLLNCDFTTHFRYITYLPHYHEEHSICVYQCFTSTKPNFSFLKQHI